MVAAAAGANGEASAASAPRVRATSAKSGVPERNRRPYDGLDWSNVVKVKTTSHGHCTSQWWLNQYLKRGLELITMSNYYPSAPWCPAANMTENYYKLHHTFPVMVNGVRRDGPFDWNAIIDPWKSELSADYAKDFPFVEGGRIFQSLPAGILEAPNAEHHRFLLEDGSIATNLHMCSPGSTFASGTFDAHNYYKTLSHGYNYGSGEYWGTAIDRMIDGMVYPDGGGVTINHPSWTKLDRYLMAEILDWDPRVLGIEVIEGKGYNSESYWDWALSTGRQCFGFFVPDWWVDQKVFGANILCVPEKTVHECMKAYRLGNFYGAKNAQDELAFTSISFNDGEGGTKTISATTDKTARFEIITSHGVVKETTGTSVTWSSEMDGEWQGPKYHIFARVKAYATDGSGEELFSQPFMLT
jgi:hypothetical protein